ncbi:MAG: glycogen synthase [Spirochaetes bacterium]|nr:MAG: glycogen synthase [Spirochaetota bacterium]
MKIAFVTSEAYPFAKTGGLADVAFSLPRSLAAHGHEVRIFMPRYYRVDKERFGLIRFPEPLGVPVGKVEKWAAVLESAAIPGVKTHFIEHDQYFGRDGLYDDGYREYGDNAERFTFFCRAVMQAMKVLRWIPDIIHCNDWQSGLVPFFHKTAYRRDPGFSGSATVASVHNAGFQGVFPLGDLALTGCADEPGAVQNASLNGSLCFLKAGLVYSEAISTVSRTYRDELMTPEYGYELAGVFRELSGRFFGITNGADYGTWNPETDPFIPARYGPGDLAGKRTCAGALRARMGLESGDGAPILATVTRVTRQKGMDVLADTMELLLVAAPFQFVMLGSGDDGIIAKFERLRKIFPERVGLYWGYDEKLAHLMEAGSDIYLMPSRYEPCGLNQLYSLRYGTVPVVRATGGLEDTVSQWDPRTGSGNGFKFKGLTRGELYHAIRQALRTHLDNAQWRVLQANAMAFKRTWDDAVPDYERMYEFALAEARGGRT